MDEPATTSAAYAMRTFHLIDLSPDNSRPPLLPPALQGKALRKDPYPRSAFFRWPAASPQASHLPCLGRLAPWQSPIRHAARLRVYRPVGSVSAFLPCARRSRVRAGWGEPRILVHCFLAGCGQIAVVTALSKASAWRSGECKRGATERYEPARPGSC